MLLPKHVHLQNDVGAVQTSGLGLDGASHDIKHGLAYLRRGATVVCLFWLKKLDLHRWLHLPAANARVLNTNTTDKSTARTTNDDRDDAMILMTRLLGDFVGLCLYG